MRGVALKYVPETFREYSDIQTVEKEVAVGLYIRDLLDVNNKQTSLLDPIQFAENHVYQFGWLDAPFSLTHFAVLHNGEIRFFEAFECGCKANNLKSLRDYLTQIFATLSETERGLGRIENHERLKLTVPFEGSTDPRWVCSERVIK